MLTQKILTSNFRKKTAQIFGNEISYFVSMYEIQICNSCLSTVWGNRNGQLWVTMFTHHATKLFLVRLLYHDKAENSHFVINPEGHKLKINVSALYMTIDKWQWYSVEVWDYYIEVSEYFNCFHAQVMVVIQTKHGSQQGWQNTIYTFLQPKFHLKTGQK